LEFVRCDEVRVGLSARLDGEDPGASDALLDRHVADCWACAAWLDEAAGASRRVRLRVPEPQPDLAEAVARRLADREVLERPSRPLARLALVVTAIVQLALSLPALVLGQEPHAGVHVAREVGATDVALALGVLAAAWRPWRAAGMLPVVAALAVGLSATTLVDVFGGEVPAVAEVPHLLALVEAALLWRLRYAGTPKRTAPAPRERRLRRVA
jgi:predicted anti-sigma-YlaC factor YlaD